MALSSSGMFVCDETLPLSPKECLRLRQWMFSTDYHNAAVTHENRTTNAFLQRTAVRTQLDEKTPTGSEKEESSARATTSELIQDPRLDAVDLHVLTSRERNTAIVASEVDVDNSTEPAVGTIPVSGLTALESSGVTAHLEGAVASLHSDTRPGGAQSCKETTLAVRCGEVADGFVCRKRMRKQPGMISRVNKICEGSLCGLRSNISPTRKTLSFPSSAAAHDLTHDPAAGYFQPPPARLKTLKGLIHAAAVAADCRSDITEEKSGSLNVVVRKGDVRISKRFSPTDHRDRLPDLMFHMERICPFSYSATAAYADGCLVPTSFTDENLAAESPQGVAYHFRKAARGNVSPSLSSDPPQADAAASDLREKVSRSGEDMCGKNSMTENPADKWKSYGKACVLGAASRVKAGAQLYRDWVCKHFDQVHHYLSCSETYLQPDARSRERAASLALHMLLNLAQDDEQQRYLHWVTEFLNSLGPGGTADTHSTEGIRSSGHQKDLVYPPHNAADSACASSTICTGSTLHHTPLGAPCNDSTTTMRTGRARASPGFIKTPSSTILGDFNKAPHSGAIFPPSGVETPVSHLPSDASNIAAVAAQLFENLRLLNPTECTTTCATQAQPVFQDAHVRTELPEVKLSQGCIGPTGEEPATRETQEGQYQDGRECSRLYILKGRIANSAAAAAATPPPSRDTTGHLAAAERFVGPAAGNAGAFDCVGIMAAVPGTATPATRRPSASTYNQTTPLAHASKSEAWAPEAYRGGAVPTSIIQIASAATPLSSAPETTSETETAEPKAAPVPVTDAESVVATEGSVCTTPEMRPTANPKGKADAESSMKPDIQPADYLTEAATQSKAGECTKRYAARDALLDEVAAIDAAGMLAIGAPGQSSAIACRVPADQRATQVEFEGISTLLRGEKVEQRYREPVLQKQDAVVSNAEALPEEVLEAVKAFVKSFPHENDALAWLDKSDFFSVLQTLQIALEQPASNYAQQESPSMQQRSALHDGQQSLKQHACQDAQARQEASGTQERGDAVANTMQQRNADAKQQVEHLAQHQERGEQSIQQQQSQEAHPGVQSQQHQPSEDVKNQYGGKHRGVVWGHEDDIRPEVLQRCHQQDHDPFPKVSVASKRFSPNKPQARDAPEEQAGPSAESSICGVLCSLQKRLPTTSRTSLDQTGILQETSLFFHDTNCSSQDSMKVLPCAEDFLVQALNSFTAKESFAASSEGDSHATQSVWRSMEDAVSGMFPSYVGERTAAPESDCASFSSRSTSSTSACATIGGGNTCWPLRNNISHSEQHELTHEGLAEPTRDGFSLPVEETGRRSVGAEIYSNQATAAAIG